jgi:hypothetical protein
VWDGANLWFADLHLSGAIFGFCLRKQVEIDKLLFLLVLL